MCPSFATATNIIVRAFILALHLHRVPRDASAQGESRVLYRDVQDSTYGSFQYGRPSKINFGPLLI